MHEIDLVVVWLVDTFCLYASRKWLNFSMSMKIDIFFAGGQSRPDFSVGDRIWLQFGDEVDLLLVLGTKMNENDLVLEFWSKLNWF